MLRATLICAALMAAVDAAAIDCQAPQFSPQAKHHGVCQFQDQAGVYSCPDGCSCFYRPANKSNIIDCRSAGLTHLPEAIPIYAETVFNELNLDGNRLEEFSIGSRQGYTRLTHLRLSHNKIHTFNPTGLPRDLHLIDLSHNRLDRLSEEVLCLLTTGTDLRSVALSGNPFICDCPGIKVAFLLRGGFKQIIDAAEVLCPNGKQLNQLQAIDVCEDGFRPQPKPCHKENHQGQGISGPPQGHYHNKQH